MTVGEALGLDSRQINGGGINDKVINTKLSNLQSKDPALYNKVVSKAPQLTALSGTISGVNTATKTVGTVDKATTETKEGMEAFTPVINVPAVPKLINNKLDLVVSATSIDMTKNITKTVLGSVVNLNV
jgi:hypothetical protein